MQSPPTPPSMYGNNDRYFSKWNEANKENIPPSRHGFGTINKSSNNRDPLGGSLRTHELRSAYTDLVIDASTKHTKKRDEYEIREMKERHEEQKQRLAKRQSTEISKLVMDQTVRQVLRQSEIRTECEHKLDTMTDSELLLDLCGASDRCYLPESPPYAPCANEAFDAFDVV